MKKLIIIYFLALLNLNYGQCRVNFVNIGGDYILEIVESGEDFEVISHNGIGADFTARIATGALQKADFQVKIVNYSSINSKCGFNLKNSRNSGSYANPGRGLVELNEKLTNEQIDGMRKLSEKMDRNVEQIKQNQNSNNTYNSSSSSNTESASSFYNKGVSKFLSNDFYGAIFDFTKAIELKPDYASAYSNRGNAKHSLEDHYGAIQDYTVAIKLNNAYSAAYFNRGTSKAMLKDFNGAIFDFTKAIELKSDYASAYQSRGAVKKHTGKPFCPDFKKACELGICGYYDKYCKQTGYDMARNEVNNNSSNNKIDYKNRALAKLDLKDYDGAILIISNHIKLNNQDAEAFISRGYVKWKKACSILKKEHNIDITSDVNMKYAYGKKPFTTNGNRIREISEIYNLELPDFCADFSKGCTLKGDCDYWKKACK